MKTKGFFLIIIFTLILILYNCASLLIDETIIKGKVQLSDNPSYGHSGVFVSCGRITTTTNSDGIFELTGDVMGDITLEVKFQKPLYIEKIVQVDIPYPAEGEKDAIEVDVGTVVLERTKETYITVFSDDFNRSTVGSNYQLNVPSGGSVSIDNGKLRLYNSNNYTDAFIIAPGTNLINMSITFDFDNGITSNSSNLTFVYLRYIDKNNNYRISIKEDSRYAPNRQDVYIERVVEGYTSIIARIDGILINPGRYEFKVVTNELSFKNVTGGSNIDLKAIDDKLYAAGRCGFSVNEESTTFDNIVLSEVEFD
jgi:hypothetical protein